MKLPSINTLFVPVLGTLDLSTPPIAKKAGSAINALNVQPIWGGGFGRIEGYEPIDGKTKPSDYTFYTAIVNQVPDPQIIGKMAEINGTSGEVILIEGDLVYMASAGMQGDSGDLLSIPELGLSYTITLIDKEYGKNTAEEFTRLRADVQKRLMQKVEAVPGTGLIRGVVSIDDALLAIRDNADATEALVSIGTETGWQTRPETHLIEVKDVTDPLLLVRGSTFTVDSVTFTILESDFAADGKTGWIATREGGIALNKSIVVDAATVATVSKASDRVKVSAGGQWQFVYHNFYSDPATFYAYGCNGEQVAEFRPDGTVIPLQTAGLEKPIFIEEHRNHLFVAFKGGSYGHSRVGYPMSWSGLLGAEQFSTGDEITGFKSIQGGAMIIAGSRSINALFGEVRDNWVIKRLTSKVGVKPGMLTSTFVPVAQTTNGLIRVDSTDVFGDLIASEIQANKQAPKAAIRPYFAIANIPESNQVRFYGEKAHLIVEIQPDAKTRTTEFTYPQPLRGVWQSPDNLFFAFDDGRIYRQNAAVNSFAGEPIFWDMRLAYSHCGTPTVVKNWKSAELQMNVANALSLKFYADLDYGTPDKSQTLVNTGIAYGGGGRWNESDWNDFYWTAPDYATPIVSLSGNSRNISISLTGSSDHEENFDISGFILNYIPRRQYRV